MPLFFAAPHLLFLVSLVNPHRFGGERTLYANKIYFVILREWSYLIKYLIKPFLGCIGHILRVLIRFVI